LVDPEVSLMRAFRFSAAAAAVAALGIAVGGCGEDRNDESSGSAGQETTKTEESAKPTGKAVATVSVTETEFKLDPADPSVAKAGVVKFKVKNDGQIVHALEVEGPGEEAKTKAIQPGKSATLEADLNKAGSYEWYCPVGNHKQQGMKGTIKVAGGGSGGATTEEDKDSGAEDSGGGSGGY